MADDNNLFQARRARLAGLLASRHLDAAAIVPGANLYYLTGVNLHLMERPTILFFHADGSMRAVIPELERSKWNAALPEAETRYWQDSDGYDDAFAKAGAGAGSVRIGVEGQRMRVFEYEAIRRGFPSAQVSDAEACIAEMRLCKDAAELSQMKTAIAISERALSAVAATIQTGMTERKIQAMLKTAMLDEGAEGFAFEPIVLAGANAANPHGHPGAGQLASGQPLLFDFGASAGGYHADITRTFFCETVSERNREIYTTVLEANALGRSIAGPGVSAHDVDRKVTELMRSSPFADMVVHRTGHGLGLYVHEEPQVMMGNHYRLEDGVVITVEPGLYAPGEIGVRIEDDVVITSDGCESLTSFDRDIVLVG